MDSDTSSELNINFLDNQKTFNKGGTSETDYYLDLIANQNKTRLEEPNISSELELSDTEKDDDRNSSSSIPAFENIKIPKEKKSPRNNSVNSSPRKSSKNSSRKSSRHSNNDNTTTEQNYSYNKQSNNNTYNQSYTPVNLSPQQQRMKKIEMLRKLSELKAKGYKLSKEYSFNSSIEEMQYEYDLLRSFADKRNGIKLYKNLILNACNVIEFANDKYDPFNFKLSGWSEHMNVEVDNYDDVLEELYEKYRGAGGSMPPELKLLLLILASASAFHFSKKMESSIPGLNEVYKNNSSVISDFISGKKEKSQYMSEQELNIQRQKEEMRENERKHKIQPNRQMPQQPQEFVPPQQPQAQYQQSYQPVNQQPQQRPMQMEEPINRAVIQKSDDVNEILRRLHSNDGTEEESSINNDRIVSDTTISEGGTRRRKKKPMMVIN
jgi:hypothetical protein